MLLTVLMRWPALIAVLAIGGSTYYSIKEYGAPDSFKFTALTKKDAVMLRDGAVFAGTDHLAAAQRELPASTPVYVQPAQIEARTSEAPAVLAPPAVVRTVPMKKVPMTEQYVVREGDSLSKIARERTSSADVQRTVMTRIFYENSEAFVDGDWNHLRAGAVITVPILR